MQGLVLGMGLLLLAFSYQRKDRKIVFTSKICMKLFILNIFLLIVCICQVVFDSSYMYVDTGIREEILEDDDKIENTSSNTYDITENKYNIREDINKIMEMPDFVKNFFVAIIVFFIATIFYKQSLIKKYCENLEVDLYELQHKWLNRKSLKNMLITIQVVSESDIKEYDICEYFRNEFRKDGYAAYMILGNPGEGKTVSIRQICDMILQERKSIEEKNKFWKRIWNMIRGKKVEENNSEYYKEGFIPIMLEFSQIRNTNTVEEFYDIIVKHIYKIANSKHILRKIDKVIQKTNQIIELKMKQGKFIFLLDGYDEITEEERYQIVKIIEQYRMEYRKCSFILCSRTAVYETSPVPFVAKEKTIHLIPFTNEKISEFLAKWNFENGKQYWELYEQIINNYQLERLAKNPLLLTLIAYLYEVSVLETPTSITRFYLMAIQCLLEQWENEKHIFPRIRVETWMKNKFLEKTANWVFHNRYDFTKKEIMKETKEFVEYGISQQTIFNEIYMHSGILENNGEQFKNNKFSTETSYKFYHRSFYEFFAAQYFVNNESKWNIDLESQQNYRIAFFYFSLSKNTKELENYIEYHMDNLSIIEPLLLERTIENQKLVYSYVHKKINQEYSHNESYYQMLGNIAEKYKYLSPQIYNFFVRQLEEQVKNSNMNQLVYIIKGLSYFCDGRIVSNLLIDYRDVIKWDSLTIDASVQFNDSILYLLQSELVIQYKIDILDGLRKSGRYSFLYYLFQKLDNNEIQAYIMYEFLQLTKNTMFINWFDKQDLFYKIKDEKLRNDIIGLRKHYGWKWDNKSDVQILNRYVLVYYLMNMPDSYNMDMYLVSNKIKFVATYIKNMDQNENVKSYYIDIPEYKVESTIEFKFHWDNAKTIERLIYNPIIIRNTQWIVCIALFWILLMIIVVLKNQDICLKQDLYTILEGVKMRDEVEFYKIANELSNRKRSYLKISRYIKPDSHMIIFYFSWVYLQIETYKQYIDNAYSRKYWTLYTVIAMGYLVGYFFIFQDIGFRIAGTILALMIYFVSIFQHRFNMPSFREPQFNRIRKYLENDEL